MNRKQTSRERLFSEWMNHLATEIAGKGLIGHTIRDRQRLLGQVERAEDEVEHREGRCKVLLASRIGRCVMPAMKYRASNHIAERPQRPVKIGMDKRRMRYREWPEHHQRIG